MVKIAFHLIRVNKRGDKLEIIFPFGGEFWRLDWDKVPSRFKHLYVVYLKLQGREIPEELKKYETNTVTVEDVSIRIDLSKCRRVPPNYPLGG